MTTRKNDNGGGRARSLPGGRRVGGGVTVEIKGENGKVQRDRPRGRIEAAPDLSATLRHKIAQLEMQLRLRDEREAEASRKARAEQLNPQTGEPFRLPPPEVERRGDGSLRMRTSALVVDIARRTNVPPGYVGAVLKALGQAIRERVGKSPDGRGGGLVVDIAGLGRFCRKPSGRVGFTCSTALGRGGDDEVA